MLSTQLFEVSNLTKKYKGEILALDNVSFFLEKNKMYSITGHSGAGKSTLLHIIGLLEKPSEGTIIFAGQDCSKMSENDKAKIRNKDIGFIFQSYLLNPKLRAYENVMLPMFLTSLHYKDMKKRAMELLSAMGLSNRATHFPAELSGGEQQRIAIARALANDPLCILADEPTGNLDIDNEKLVFEILHDLARQGKCVVTISHNSIIQKYSDHCFLVENGIIKERN